MDTLMVIGRGILGLASLIGIAYLFSNRKSQINWRTVGIGVLLQFIFALFILKVPFGKTVFQSLGTGFQTLLSYTTDGASFIFGGLATGDGGVGFIFAFQVLPTIIFFSAFMSLMYHLGWIQPLVKGFGWVMAKTMNLSGAESLSAAANVFVGQTEAPLVVRPFIGDMTHSELMTMMVGGMATIAGGVLAAYILFLGGDDPARQAEFAAHLLAASIMSAPAAIVMAKILIPETQKPKTMGSFEMEPPDEDTNALEAAAVGASDGMKLAANVGAMLLAFFAIIALLNGVLGWLGNPIIGGFELYNINDDLASATDGRFSTISLQAIFGYVFAPISWLMGVESKDILSFGTLLGEKIAVSEFVAYVSLGHMEEVLSERSVIIGTYALCGFANFASIAIQIGGIGGLAPERRGEIAKLGMLAVLGGALASWMTATIAGMLI